MNNKSNCIPVVKKEALNLDNTTEITNGTIESADISIAGHFGNTVCLSLKISSEGCWGGCFLPMRNYTNHIGHVVKAVFETICEATDDTVSFSSLTGKPIRVISKGGSYVGIGHFMKDKWLTEENVTEWMRKN